VNKTQKEGPLTRGRKESLPRIAGDLLRVEGGRISKKGKKEACEKRWDGKKK